ncbi:helix-turn-helix transcriptional regulator [Paenibacillus albidus]|uniref:AraC family transcriptional regulator n=1 Tax=Paenibacillus albidus TaxID=2041023 RepID=UPI001BECDBBC|nr:AraC family transcriptional regulator [Paenibacillus albidus]MBT2290160.1 helix-turn-helix transcriptional regulator [Paenibacillus albidus]
MEYMKHESIKVSDESLAWIYLHSENNITSVENHWHRSLEMTLVLKGDCLFNINGNPIIVRENELLLINGGDVHSCEMNYSMPSDALSIILPYSFMKQAYPQIETASFCLQDSSPHYHELAALFREALLVLESRNNNPHYQLKLNSLFYEIMYLLLAHFLTEKHSPLNVKSKKYWDRCYQIIDYVDEHYREPLTLASVANEHNISKEHLARTFKEYMGTTFKKYLTRVRLYYAYQQLIYSDFSLLHISMKEGFTDSRSFINSFKEVYGTTPQKYRKDQRAYLRLKHRRMFTSNEGEYE